jgi:hypothetical protein
MRDLVVRLRDEADYQIEASARGINAFVTPNIRILLRGAADALMTAEREIAALHDAGWTVSSKLEAAERELAECRGKRDDKAEARAEEAERVIDAVRQTIEWRGGESLVITEALAAYDKKKNPDDHNVNHYPAMPPHRHPDPDERERKPGGFTGRIERLENPDKAEPTFGSETEHSPYSAYCSMWEHGHDCPSHGQCSAGRDFESR